MKGKLVSLAHATEIALGSVGSPEGAISTSARRSLVAAIMLCGVALPARGAESAEAPGGGVWVGLELGAASLRRSAPEALTESTWYMSFKGGFAATERLLVGMEIGGYTLEAGDLWDSSEGEGVSQVFVVGQYYFDPRRAGWYLKGGGGYVSYWNNRPNGLEDTGWGVTAALGYDWRTTGLGTIGPVVGIGYGKASDLDHKAVSLALSWSFP